MPPFEDTLEPVALKGEAVELQPTGQVHTVTSVEQMARVGPVDFGAATAGSDAQENNSSIIELDDELEMDPGTLGQFWVNPLSNVEIEIRQTGQQEQRFVNSNQVGKITPRTPRPMRQIFVNGDDVPYAIVSNPTANHDYAKTLVYFTGYKLGLSPEPLSRGEVQEMRGQPAAVPVDSLKQHSVGGRP